MWTFFFFEINMWTFIDISVIEMVALEEIISIINLAYGDVWYMY